MHNIARRDFIRALGLGITGFVFPMPISAGDGKQLPNIVYILADDFGYGDIKAFNPDHCKIETPNLDRLVSQGVNFTDVHSGSAVCTPTRYGILTGRYCWRTRLQRAVLRPYDPPLIPRARLTVASLLKQHGYSTACIGKWHLGWNWQKDGRRVVFDKPVQDGPTSLGFDYYFGVDVPNYPPYCFLENDHTVGQPTAFRTEKNLDGLPGPMLPGWKFDEILPELTRRCVDYVHNHAKQDKPFFLYFTMTSPHEPVAPSEQFKGKSNISPIADFLMETDWSAGALIKAIDESGCADNTILIFTADNGHSTYTGLEELLEHGHKPSGPFRGYKSNIWEGGHRIPFIARWPGKIKSGSQCEHLTCLTDLMATCAELVGAELPDNAGEDSVSMLPAMLGKTDKPLRNSVIHHSSNGRFAIRQNNWKLVFCPGSGGYGFQPDDKTARQKGLPELQLYDLSSDIAEENNLYDKHPELIDQLSGLMNKYIAEGRSTPGQDQHNDVEVLWNVRK